MKILKLGGSIITVKSEYLKINSQNIRRISEELSEIKEKYILVHGAGSFGHIKALEYDLNKEISVEKKQREIARVIRDVEYLNSLILDELISKGIPAVGLPPHSVFSPDLNQEVLKNLLDSGFIPVLYGDGFVWNKRHRILSGDEIIYHIAKNMKIEKVIFATDVDGIYTKDPKLFKDAILIDRINKGNQNMEFTSSDATGSMMGKMEKINSIIDYVDKVIVTNGNVEGNIKNAMLDINVKGTVIEK